ncbi:MAG: transposase [Magnetococcales bacterium]|nr:transposase [Magnetococcales bacterium]
MLFSKTLCLQNYCENSTLDTALEWCRLFRVELLAYCLMNNHVHLILKPSSEDRI